MFDIKKAAESNSVAFLMSMFFRIKYVVVISAISIDIKALLITETLLRNTRKNKSFAENPAKLLS
ncbi:MULTISPECIES: hypothetical protein [unclassified Arcicella]|uniref:hypothetical protein n=1 Tax=unclassified Arcicella TaxID=2644986 RepID=UPI002864ECB3|nr:MULTISPECIES: hypothetical protein [unclassified Arcicella]MDR6563691.1 hypothetical protein [Arcicella sp. BE51]MDR6814171.1 hypothetical protein [Arcicella sp. BE140]MDR6825590.1 hypothetical protein [Arcicella sp. BE139]